MKKVLRLKKIDSLPDSTRRIYDLTRESCESFNCYYLDFFGSIDILREQAEKFAKQGEAAKLREAEEKITYMKGKISELDGFMLDLVEKMGDFVELIEA